MATLLRSGALVLFGDYTNPHYSGAREAVGELGLEGERRGELFVHRHETHIGNPAA